MISVFDRYVLKFLAVATCVTAASLTLLILLTQSIRFLELVIGADASSAYFLIMMGLAVPKFLEAVLPIAFAIAIVFACYRMILEREMIVFFAAGLSPGRLARPFILFAGAMMAIQFCLSAFIAPVAVHNLQTVRGDVRNHYATLLFREGVFTEIGPGLTAYVARRTGMNTLENLMIHDERGALNEGKITTLVARRGIVDLSDGAQSLLVYDGTQYERDPDQGTLTRLDFRQYTLDIPAAGGSIGPRWREPDERLLPELFIPADTADRTAWNARNEFLAEAHRRISTPFLYPTYALVAVGFLLLGQWNRRRPGRHVVKAGLAVVMVQAVYIVLYNATQSDPWMAVLLYLTACAPGLVAAAALFPRPGGGMRRLRPA